MTETRDLFGKKPKPKKKRPTKLESRLLKLDKNSFSGRLDRLKFIYKVYPKGLLLSGDMEFVFTFTEVKDCFISGHFIATIVLAQAFIEKIFRQLFIDNGQQKEANEGLASMIKFARKNKLINTLIIDKVDELRLKRNPFTHTKDYNYSHTLQRRTLKNETQPNKQLENDAKDAIQILFLVLHNKL